MNKWLMKIDRLSNRLLEGLKNVLPNLQNKRLLKKLVVFTLGILSSLIVIIWICFLLIEKLFQILMQNKEIIIISLIIICMIYSSIVSRANNHRSEKVLQRLNGLERQKKNALIHYTYLRLFLYKILDERLCNLIEIVKPVTPNLLNAVTPITIDDRRAIIYYNFQVHKLKIFPFTQGTDFVANLLSSHIIGKAQIEGIEGITAPIGDSLVTPIYVDTVKDLGSTATIVLVMDCEAYRALKETVGQTVQTRELIEHI